ncbi:MAG: SIS domain-containing protein [Planctomycetota bacterium]
MAKLNEAAVDRALDEHLNLLQWVKRECRGAVVEAAERIVQSYRTHGKVLLFGNGGSASDALHIEGELVNRFYKDRPGLPAIALGASVPSLTAIANDYSYQDLFARLVEAHGRRGDVALGLSTSGNSENVVRGLKRARELGLATIAFTGEAGGRCRDHADHLFALPSRCTPRIQEAHITLGHVLCELVEAALFA